MPSASAGTQSASVTVSVTLAGGRETRRLVASAQVAELVAAKVSRRAQRGVEREVVGGVEQQRPGGRGAVVLVGQQHDGQQRVRAQEPLVFGGRAAVRRRPARATPRPAGVRSRSRSRRAARCRRTRRRGCPCSSRRRRCWRCTWRPAARLVAVQSPRAVYWKMPALPSPSQPEIEPSPAPMSDDTTAMCRSGSPPGSASSAVTNAGKLRTRLFCASVMLRRVVDQEQHVDVATGREAPRATAAGATTAARAGVCAAYARDTRGVQRPRAASGGQRDDRAGEADREARQTTGQLSSAPGLTLNTGMASHSRHLHRGYHRDPGVGCRRCGAADGAAGAGGPGGAGAGGPAAADPTSAFATSIPARACMIMPADLPPPRATKSVDNPPRVVARPKGALPQAPAGFTVQLYADGLSRAAAVARRAQRRRVRGRERSRRDQGRARHAGDGQGGVVGRVRQGPQAAVRDRVPSGGRRSALAVRRQHRFGRALRLPQRRHAGARRARDRGRAASRRRAADRRRALDARHRVLARRQDDVRVGGLALERRRSGQDAGRIRTRGPCWRSRPTAAAGACSRPAFATRWASPFTRARASCGRRSTSATSWATTWSPTTSRTSRTAGSTAGPGTTSAATRIRGTAANTLS